MNKNLKILIIGFGSIGQRHFKNLESLGFENVFVFDSDESKVKDQKQKVNDLDQKTLGGFDAAFICNPNNKHIEIALTCAEVGLDLFIEKPLSHNLKGIKKLEKICRKKRLVNMVACNMRFFPAFAEIKKFVSSGNLGKIYSINHEFGQFLPFWRPGTDYRQNYAAKKNTGGGIALDDIHEFDLLFWLNDFVEVDKNFIIKNKSSELEIETEDQTKAIFQFKNGVLGSVSSDYLSKTYNRKCFIVGEKGNLKWNWKDNEVVFENESEEKVIYRGEKTETNQMYIDEIKYFLEAVENRQDTFNDVGRAKLVLSYLI